MLLLDSHSKNRSMFWNSFLTASFRSHAQRKELYDCKDRGNEGSQEDEAKHEGLLNQNFIAAENSSSSANSTESFGDTQLEIFHHRHGLLILHLLAAMMFVPSLVAWLQVWMMLPFACVALKYCAVITFGDFNVSQLIFKIAFLECNKPN